jgi:ASC-1-like (ASCH) protein
MESPVFEFREVDRARFEEVRSGIKQIETRAAKEKYLAIKAGDTVTFVCGSDSFTKTVARVYHWPSAEAMLHEVELKRVMPDLITIEQVNARYASYPGYPELIAKVGLLGFELND